MNIKNEVLDEVYEDKMAIYDNEYEVERAIDLALEKVVKLIDADIKYQKRHLTGNFKQNKPFKWRIVGMEMLKERVEGKR